MIKYLLLLLLLTFSGLLYCADDNEIEIKGGFGYVLGDDGSKLKGNQIDEDSIYIQAKSSFRSFTKCRIELNEDKQIYAISGRAVLDSEKDTDRELKIVLNMLEKKYKAKFEDTTNRSNSKNPDQIVYSLQRGSKNIALVKQSKTALRINYWDNALGNAQRERKKRSNEQKNNNDMDSI